MSEQLPIESFHWEPKLARFWEILGVKLSDYQDSNSKASQKVQQRLKEFDTETLLALMSDGVEICCQILETINDQQGVITGSVKAMEKNSVEDSI